MIEQHTPEPWAFGEDNDGWYVEKGRDQFVYGLTEANAHRIVACVNACAATSTSCKPKARWIDTSQRNAGRGTF